MGDNRHAAPTAWTRIDRTTHPARVRTQMDPKFLRNLRFAKKWNGKGRPESDD